MKTERKKYKKEFDTVSVFRGIKVNISNDLKGLSFKEIKEYLKANNLKSRDKNKKG